MFSRRAWMTGALGAAAALGLPRRARAIGPSSKFRFGQLQLAAGASWNPRPSALHRLGWEVQKRTSIEVELSPAVVTPTSDKLHMNPFLYLAGEAAFDLPSPSGIDALRRFLTFGGFLLIDSAEGSTDGAFSGSVRKLVSAIFPSPSAGGGRGLEVVPSDHVVYKSFYLLERPLGRLAISGAMEAVVRDGRIVLAYVANDLGGAWARDDFGNHDFPCEPGGDRQRELAYRMGINFVMYALCLDYKSDQVHVPFIMKRRRWKPDDGALSPSPSLPPPTLVVPPQLSPKKPK
ncbi:MAG: DUF4159 domain-containing protein [Deltaproteobacteria bacterium]|nr:DUF4159 domain-containing protein [Deltaproteobacteria bacterium]MCW5808692.1 DUF4159 domain-containing protein [Deltaproteobacteria bacterium]